ncbi:hypothetical protein [Clostridium transplantifaecale]|uniref:hypothetical protein n=1 Tax=Clostridium transplantifaecale TaxID=2479838 RepID=UPI0013DDFC17|nr:hypothetical protein [Clostridium transplantifaecale]
MTKKEKAVLNRFSDDVLRKFMNASLSENEHDVDCSFFELKLITELKKALESCNEAGV